MSRFNQDWIQQTWMLHQADVLWLCGHKKKASSLARKATIKGPGIPLIRGLTGIFLRWATAIASSDEERLELSTIATSAWHQRERLDALDRYELTQSLQRTSETFRTIPVDLLKQEARLLEHQIPASAQDVINQIGLGAA